MPPVGPLDEPHFAPCRPAAELESELRAAQVVVASTPELIDAVRELMRAYALEWPGGDLQSPDFQRELADLSSAYQLPDGTLLVALSHGAPTGCVAMRQLSASTCEIKRMYVVPERRGQGIGCRLLCSLIETARNKGCAVLRVDTSPAMLAAQALYRSFGFKRVEQARAAPDPATLVLELRL